MLYEPAEDSFLLAECIRVVSPHILKNKNASFLDMGVGSCIQAETALQSGFKVENILTADINKKALRNAKIKGFKAVYSDLFSNIDKKFDLIVFNAPYLPYNKYDNKKDTCGGKEGYETAVRFVAQLRNRLAKKGIALLVASSLSKPEVIRREIKRNKLKCRKIASSRIFFEEIMIFLIKR